ncbi:hypothetical protein LZZ85_10580 [Terrimonas sp. NA20]|uniref:SUKH-4 immunity protein n=1 Tax=Terrimonas ginsenosidimutans TaxID=2908004 RepID=A0ABS9KR19_9BACT|nr:hypothetical protein [Terrimonas ginsenosidimutans]MCG2614730.1 hypothetical protein [Terrimonas ginsenosidimutans]
MDIYQISQYWTDHEEELCKFDSLQLKDPRLLRSTIDFLINCGLPRNCAPGLSFETYNDVAVPTSNTVFNIDIDGLDSYFMIGSNGCGDPVCVDLDHDNEIVYLNHDNYFDRIFINSSIHQLAECIIRYRNFYLSLDSRFENNIFAKRKFSDDEFYKVSGDFKTIDAKCLEEDACWKSELEYLVWERDNE